MKVFTILLAVAACFLLFSLCVDADGRGGRQNRRRKKKGRKGARNRSRERANILSTSWADGLEGWLETLLGGEASISSNGDSVVWSLGDSSLSVSSNGDDNFIPIENVSPVVETGTAEEVEEPAVPEEESIPWRGRGSFTGDLRLDCMDSKCTKGAVQVFNRERGTWGYICGDHWTLEESQVVCNFLQFSRGARKALLLKAAKLSEENRSLPTIYRGVTCVGNEASIIECSGEEVSDTAPCESIRFAGVVCIGQKLDSQQVECTPPQIPCANREKCIDQSYVCDGMSDCPWGTDEQDCEDSDETCPVSYFWCGRRGGGCIRNSFRCDGDRDCIDGSDEENCEDYLSQFTVTENRKLASRRYEAGWRNVSPYMCSKLCREETSFECVSFDYNKRLKECDLSSFRTYQIGLSSTNFNFDHYEVPRVCVSGDRIFCENLCLTESQICDGEGDCPGLADEQNCPGVAEPSSVNLELSGGATPSEGRLLISLEGGQSGLVCDIGWSINEANVACRQLGYSEGALMALPGLFYSRTKLQYKISGVSCNGDETALDQCRHDSWTSVTCPLDHDAGVVCRTAGEIAPPVSPPSTTARGTTTTTRAPTTTTTTPAPQPPVTTRRQCGVKPAADSMIRPRIVGGNNAQPHEWPWQVGIWLPWQFLCGATLIDECWVLTAAHCFSRPFPLRQYIIRLGDHQTKVSDGTEQDFKIERLIQHAYDKSTHDNDIALIQLQQKNGRCAVLTEAVQLACLPTSPTQFPPGTRCNIVGWGQTQSNSEIPFTSVLKESTVPLISRNDCRYRTVYGSSLSTNMLCAGYLRGGIDTCQGDSGGPLLCKSDENDRYYVWGVVSWGNGCAQPRSPGIYTVVSNYIDWIRRNTGITN